MKKYIRASKYDDPYYDLGSENGYYRDIEKFEDDVIDEIYRKTGYEVNEDYGIAASGRGISQYFGIGDVFSDDSPISDDKSCLIWFPETLEEGRTPEEVANQFLPYVEMSVKNTQRFRK